MKLQQPTAKHARLATSNGPILVAMDGTYASGEALLWSARLSTSFGTDLVAVRAWHRGLGNLRPSAAAATGRSLRVELDSWCRLDAIATTPRTTVVEGDAAASIIDVAERENADLVVVGIEHMVGPSFREASPVHALTASCQRPVAVVPTGGAGRTVGEVIVALNGSPRSAAACRWVAKHAPQCGWRVHVVTVFEPFLQWVPAHNPKSIWQHLETALIGAWSEPLTSSGVAFTHQVIEGFDHVRMLTEIARNRHADLIVVGAQGELRRRHHRGGNTGIHLVNHSLLPVILVPARAVDSVGTDS